MNRQKERIGFGTRPRDRPGTPRRLLALVRERHGLPRHVLSTAAISFLLVTGVHILAPALPLYAERFGVSTFVMPETLAQSREEARDPQPQHRRATIHPREPEQRG